MAIESTGFHWKKTRFALELYIYGAAPEHPTITESRFIDDQYTPGRNKSRSFHLTIRVKSF